MSVIDTSKYVVKGYLPNDTMDAELKRTLTPLRSFDDVHHVFAAKAAAASAPATSYDIPNEPACYNQGKIGSCVLNAATGCLNIVLAVEKRQTEMLSRLWLYWLCREAMGTQDQDSGTYPHLAVDRLTKIGVPLESMWPYAESNLYLAPGPDTYPEASDNKASAFFAITATGKDRLAQMETALRADHPIMFASPVSTAIQKYQKGQVLTIPNSKDIIGGHSTVFTGVHYVSGKRYWRVRNSWGTQYGDNGHYLMDDAWASWSALNDLQVLTRMDPLLF